MFQLGSFRCLVEADKELENESRRRRAANSESREIIAYLGGGDRIWSSNRRKASIDCGRLSDIYLWSLESGRGRENR